MTNFLPDLLEVSLTTGAVIALLLLLTPVLSRRFSPRWRYFAWLFVALRLCLPFNIDLPAAPVRVEAPMRPHRAQVRSGDGGGDPGGPAPRVSGKLRGPRDLRGLVQRRL